MTDDPIMTEQTDLMQYVPKVHFEQIPIKNLVSNQEYQRNLSQHHVQRAAANFDLYQINPVKVSRRNGINYVFNGQHTIEIVALVSGSRETPVWCMVYDDLVYEHEADIFAWAFAAGWPSPASAWGCSTCSISGETKPPHGAAGFPSRHEGANSNTEKGRKCMELTIAMGNLIW